MKTPPNAHCGHPLNGDGEWPSDDGRTVCYPCFEAEADDQWWRFMVALDERREAESRLP